MSDLSRHLHGEGDAHVAAGRLEEALASFRAAAAEDPESVFLLFNVANVLRDLGRVREAIAAYDAVLVTNPGFTMAHHNRAIALLQIGEWRAGFLEYEWRKICPGFVDDLCYQLPRPWRGESLQGKTLFIYSELFQGDIIQFCRYALLAQQIGANVILGAPVAMHALLQTMSPTLTLVDADAPSPDYDFQSALMSLPLLFGTTTQAVPNARRYLHAEAGRISKWRARIGSAGFKIGIIWHGSARAAYRSFLLADGVAALAGKPGVRLISLQKYEGLDQLADVPPGSVETLGDDFDSGPDAFVDTAAAMSCCDLIVTAETSVAHLAGAIGAPTWLATIRHSDWRWLQGPTTPWYPTMRLFRQPVSGDWASVLAAMSAALDAAF